MGTGKANMAFTASHLQVVGGLHVRDGYHVLDSFSDWTFEYRT
jgi:hypothetical protein